MIGQLGFFFLQTEPIRHPISKISKILEPSIHTKDVCTADTGCSELNEINGKVVVSLLE